MPTAALTSPSAYPPPGQGLAPDALVDATGLDEIDTDVLIIGSGMGGGTLAHALADSGRDVLVVERGGFLPREPENHDAEQMHVRGRYKNAEQWYDGGSGKPFSPGVYYYVGGNTKFYGAALPRFRASDFEATEHAEGPSHAWPFSYDDLEPFYDRAERLYRAHGTVGEDPTEPPHSQPYPYPALEHEPVIERFAASLRRQGLSPFHSVNCLDVRTMADRAAVTTADGCPDDTWRKAEAENVALRPALAAGRTRLLTDALVVRLVTSPDGRRVVAAEVRHGGRVIRVNAQRVALAGGAVNSSVLLLRSGSAAHPRGLANSSDQVGRNYMVHNSTFFVGVDPRRRNPTLWQKTLGLNDWYEAGPTTRYPLGNLQMLGKLHAPMIKPARSWAPNWALDLMTDRSLDIYLSTEDLALATNRVRVSGEKILVDWTPTNLVAHHELVRRVKKAVRAAGYPFIFTQLMGIDTNSHMCGTAVAGTDPATSVLDPRCRAHDVENLWVVDGSFFPSSAALNPALTIAANALRVAPDVAA